jgi:rubrerythrin
MAHKLGIEGAVEIAMEAELKAEAFYARAAGEIEDRGGRDLLGRLAEFERYHYQKLAELAQSLKRDGRFIVYESRTLQQITPSLGVSEASAAGTPLERLADVPGILSKAIDNEKAAGERYRGLAAETDDPAGRDMFSKLAAEEALHQRVLEDEFFSLSNRGVWGWSGMYGE